MACFASTIVALVSYPLTLAATTSASSGQNGWLDRMAVGTWVSAQIGAAVLAGWVSLSVSGRCRFRRAGVLDRPGQLIGLIWIAMLPVNLFHFFHNGGWSN